MGETVSVLGAGSWGTALACLLTRNGHQVSLWCHTEAQARRLGLDRSNERYLPGIQFPPRLRVTSDLDEAVRHRDWLLLVVPSHAFAECLSRIAPLIPVGRAIAWATKGLEPSRGALLHQVARELLPDAGPLAVLSGPSFAREVALGLPTAITAGCEDEHFARRLAEALHNPRFRVYTSDDVIGIEVGGAVKNVLAIAAGVSDGLGFGANARAALITRGLHEITRLGLVLGARPETFMGLAGLGDLVLTCTDDQSRNRRVGLRLAEGKSLEEALQTIGQEAEGVLTARLVHRLAVDRGIDMPICEQTHGLLYEGLPPQQAVSNLLERELKSEIGI